VRRGIIPDCIAEGDEHLYPALRDKTGLKVDCIPGDNPEEAEQNAKFARLEAERPAERTAAKPKRGAKSDA